MSLRDDLCAQRAIIEQFGRDLAELEQRCASRNTAHVLSRARSMSQAAGELIAQALQQPLAEAAAEPIEARS